MDDGELHCGGEVDGVLVGQRNRLSRTEWSGAGMIASSAEQREERDT